MKAERARSAASRCWNKRSTWSAPWWRSRRTSISDTIRFTSTQQTQPLETNRWRYIPAILKHPTTSYNYHWWVVYFGADGEFRLMSVYVGEPWVHGIRWDLGLLAGERSHHTDLRMNWTALCLMSWIALGLSYNHCGMPFDIYSILTRCISCCS